MQMPLTQGTHSGRPRMYQGTSAGRRGSGFAGGQLALPTKVVTNTLGWMSNYTINYAYVVRRFKDRSDQALNIGQYVFIQRRSQPLGDKRLHTICNIVQVNQLLLGLATTNYLHYGETELDENGDEVVVDAQTAGRKILNEWAPLGVVCTETGYDVLAESGEQQPQERLINATVRGRVSTFNQWGKTSVRDGTSLYFILERRIPAGAVNPIDDTYRVGLKLNSPSKKVFGRPPNGDPRMDGSRTGWLAGPVTAPRAYWQFRAYANYKYSHPYFDEAEVEKHDGSQGFDDVWFAIYVGKVSSKGYVNTHGSDTHTARAHSEVNKLVTLPMYEIFCDSTSFSPEYDEVFNKGTKQVRRLV